MLAVASIIRLVTLFLTITAPPMIALYFDPLVSSRVHAAIVGSLGLTYLLTDRFFAGIRTKYGDLHKSSALTERAANSIQRQIDSIEQRLNLMWSVSVVCRFSQGLVVPLLVFINTYTLVYFFLVLFAYSTLGLSLYLLVFFWVTSIQAKRYRSWFDVQERAEQRRQEELKDFEPKNLVNS